MMTEDTKSLVIRESKGWVTNVDERDLPESYFLRLRNLRLATEGKFAQRDYGSKHRFAAALYPKTNLTPDSVTLIDSCTFTDPVDKAEFEVLAGLDSAGNLHVWAFDGTSFVELTRTFTATIASIDDNGGVSLRAQIGLTNILENGVATTLPQGADPDNCKDWVLVNTTIDNKAALIFSNTDNELTLYNVDVSGAGLGWDVGNSVVIYRSAGLVDAIYNPVNGATPHTRFLVNDTQRKVRFMYGSSDSPPETRIPLLAMRRPQRKYFWAGSPSPGTVQLTLPEDSATRWYLESGGGLFPYCATFGSREIFKIGTTYYSTDSATAPDVTNYPVNSWLKISVHNASGDGATPPFNTYSFLYITLGYDDYQESDPVFRFYCGGANTGGAQTIEGAIRINPATMPKNVTQIFIYRYTIDIDASITALPSIQAFLAGIGDDQLLLAKSINLQSYSANQFGADLDIVTTPESTEPYGRWQTIVFSLIAHQLETSDSIVGELGHTIVVNRTLLKSRYAARATKEQGAVIVTDEDDSTLRVSNYNGAGSNEDDNFPQVSVDRTGGKLIIFLTSFGELLGLSINNDIIVALKRNTIEFSDFQASQRQQVIKADVLAKRSIVQTPWGLVWAGNSAIYLLPSDGGGIEILNSEWKNFYDGTLLTSNATPVPFMNEDQRRAIICGYEPTYHALWVVMTVATEDGTSTEQIIARYYFGEKARRWDIRTFSGIDVKWLTETQRAITIGTSAALLFYPNMVGAGNFKDGVLSDDSGGTGIPVSWLINIGSLYGLTMQNVFNNIRIDQTAKGTGNLRLRFFLNEIATHFDEKFFDVNETPQDREIPAVGSLRRLRIEGALVSNLDTITQQDVNTIELKYIPRVA